MKGVQQNRSCRSPRGGGTQVAGRPPIGEPAPTSRVGLHKRSQTRELVPNTRLRELVKVLAKEAGLRAEDFT